MTRGVAVQRGLLVLILCAAAGSRFVGLTHHLERGAPDYDERNNFVDPVLRMWRMPTFDPTVYAGYPGLFNHLAFLPIGLGHAVAGHTGAYAAGRGLVAAFSVANVALIYLLGRRVYGPWLGLFAAALLLFSRVDTRSAQHITPDTLVASASLASLLVLSRSPRPRRAELWLGLAAGAATAVKYTGLLAGVPGLASLAWGERRVGRAAMLAGSSAVAFALLAPYALLQVNDQGMGLADGLKTYYGRDAADNRFIHGQGSAVASVLGLLQLTLGPVASLLAIASIGVPKEKRAMVWPAAAAVIAGIAIMTPANLVFPRHVLPAAALAAYLAAAGLAAVLSHVPEGAPRLVAAACLVPPALWVPAERAWPVVAGALQPHAIDQAAEWVEAKIRGPARLVTSLPRFQLDESRFEVRYVESLRDLPRNALAQYDVVVAKKRAEAAALDGFSRVAEFAADNRDPELPITILRPPVSSLRSAPPAAWDPAPPWRFPAGLGSIEARWVAGLRPARIEVEVAPDTDWPQAFEIQASDDGVTWQTLHGDRLRPVRPHRQLRGAPHGQVFVPHDEREVIAVRILRRDGRAWQASAVRIFVR